jgi:small subunit ribosomal protein S8
MDILANALSGIKNEIMNNKPTVVVPNTKLVKSVVEVLKKEAMISNFKIVEDGIEITLKYVNGEAIAKNFKKVSTPGQRIYVSSYEITPVVNGRGIGIISTSEGVMSTAMAKSRNLGGEYLCKVW